MAPWLISTSPLPAPHSVQSQRFSFPFRGPPGPAPPSCGNRPVRRATFLRRSDTFARLRPPVRGRCLFLPISRCRGSTLAVYAISWWIPRRDTTAAQVPEGWLPAVARHYSRGSTRMSLAFRVFAIHSVVRSVEGSWTIFFVSKSVGIWNSITCPVFGSKRARRSVMLLGAYTYPFLSGTEAVYGVVYFRGRGKSCICSVRVSNIPIRSPKYSANQNRSCRSIRPRRGMALGVSVGQYLTFPVSASTRRMDEAGKSVPYGVPVESTTIWYTKCRAADDSLGVASKCRSTIMVFGSTR